MENNQKYWFFGSKLNTALLLVLIILMVIALRWMYTGKPMYLPSNSQDNKSNSEQQTVVGQTKANEENKSATKEE